MKNFRYFSAVLLIATMFLSFNACGDDNNDFKFDPNSLKQTLWEGTIVVTDNGEIIREMKIDMQFFTVNTGHYTLKEGAQIEDYDFKYTIDGKLMVIDGGVLSSNRILIELNENKMVLQGIGSYKSIITLNRQNK